MWHVSSRSGVATLRTAVHLLLTYVLTRAQVAAYMAVSWLVPVVGSCLPLFCLLVVYQYSDRLDDLLASSPAQDPPVCVPALDGAGCRCECRVPSSHRRCCDCTTSSAPSLQMSRLDSTGTRTSDQYSDHCDDFLRVLRRRVNGVQQFATRRAAAGTRMPYGITRCYLPQGRGDTSKLVMSDYGLSRRC